MATWLPIRKTLAAASAGAAIALFAVACEEVGGPGSPSGAEVDVQATVEAALQATVTASGGPGGTGPETSPPAAADRPGAAPAPPEAPKPKFSGFDFELGEGTFWEYRWEAKSSFFAARGSSSDSDSGTFRVTLGPQQEIHGINAYELKVSGKHQVEDEDRSFAPRWRYIAVADNQVLVSEDGEKLVVLFDARAGEWPGSGFFTTRMSPKTLYEARDGSIPKPVGRVARSSARPRPGSKSLDEQEQV